MVSNETLVQRGKLLGFISGLDLATIRQCLGEKCLSE